MSGSYPEAGFSSIWARVFQGIETILRYHQNSLSLDLFPQGWGGCCRWVRWGSCLGQWAGNLCVPLLPVKSLGFGCKFRLLNNASHTDPGSTDVTEEQHVGGRDGQKDRGRDKDERGRLKRQVLNTYKDHSISPEGGGMELWLSIHCWLHTWSPAPSARKETWGMGEREASNGISISSQIQCKSRETRGLRAVI